MPDERDDSAELFECCQCGAECEDTDCTVEGDDTYCDNCHSDTFSCCDDCRNSYRIDEGYTLANGHTAICQTCYAGDYFTCDNCCEVYYCDDYRGDGYCAECHRENCCDDGEWDTGCSPLFSGSARLGSARRYGIELETDSCPKHEDLFGNTCFGSKHDGSINGKEFVSPVLCGDTGLDAVSHLCDFASRNRWKVNSTCGFHLHLDMTREDNEACRAVAIAYCLTARVWQAFMPESRRKNHYCADLQWSPEDVKRAPCFNEFCGIQGRYQWFNLAAYCEHRTFEVRLHCGTLNADKVINWVKAHTRFIDAISDMTVDQVEQTFAGRTVSELFRIIAELWDDEDLTRFYENRANEFGTHFYAGEAGKLADVLIECCEDVETDASTVAEVSDQFSRSAGLFGEPSTQADLHGMAEYIAEPYNMPDHAALDLRIASLRLRLARRAASNCRDELAPLLNRADAALSNSVDAILKYRRAVRLREAAKRTIARNAKPLRAWQCYLNASRAASRVVNNATACRDCSDYYRTYNSRYYSSSIESYTLDAICQSEQFEREYERFRKLSDCLAGVQFSADLEQATDSLSFYAQSVAKALPACVKYQRQVWADQDAAREAEQLAMAS